MLSDLSLPIVSRHVLSRLTLIQLVMLNTAYLSGPICEEIGWTIQNRLRQFYISAIRYWAEYISTGLVKQYEILIRQMESGIWPIRLWLVSVGFGEHRLFLQGAYKGSVPSIRFAVYKATDGWSFPHIKEEKPENVLGDIRILAGGRSLSPADWKKKAKKAILTALLAEYGPIGPAAANVPTGAFMAAFQQHIRRSFSVYMSIGLMSDQEDSFNDCYSMYDTAECIGGNPVQYMKKNFRGKRQQQAWMKQVVIPTVDKAKQMARDIVRPFREPMSLLKQ